MVMKVRRHPEKGYTQQRLVMQGVRQHVLKEYTRYCKVRGDTLKRIHLAAMIGNARCAAASLKGYTRIGMVRGNTSVRQVMQDGYTR